jgi:hypothetical protein
MMQQFDRMNLALAEELELRKSQERAKVIEEANLVIKAIAETGGYDLIVQQATYASSAIDITEQVLGEMAKRAAAGKEVPTKPAAKPAAKPASKPPAKPTLPKKAAVKPAPAQKSGVKQRPQAPAPARTGGKPKPKPPARKK